MTNVKDSALTTPTPLLTDKIRGLSDPGGTPLSVTFLFSDIQTLLLGGSGYPKGFLFGFDLSNNSGDATNDIDITAGSCRDSANTVNIDGTAMTKRLDANWAAGTNQGFRNSGAAITDTTYHIYAVSKAAGADPDYYAHTSTTVATVITALQAETGGSAYLYARRIGSIVRASGVIKPFLQDGDVFAWKTPVADVNAANNTGTSAVTRTLTIPTGLRLEAFGDHSNNVDGNVGCCITDLSATDIDPATNSNVNLFTSAGAAVTHSLFRTFTNTSAQVRTRHSASGAAKYYYLSTWGWIDTRGRNE